MLPCYIPSGDAQSLKQTIIKFQEEDLCKACLFLMAEKKSFSSEELASYFSKASLKIMGGIFPSLIVEGKLTNEGVLMVPLPFDLNIQCIDLNQDRLGMMNDLSIHQKDSLAPNSTVFVLFDALSSQKGIFTESLFNYFGINASYFGGGAGSLSFEPTSCIIDNDGFHKDAAIIGWANYSIDLGSAHGWYAISDPLKITQSSNNKVESLDWEPAFEVYKNTILKHSGKEISVENFFEIAKSYPLGITKMDAEMVVRDPFKADKKGIQFFDYIQEGEYVKILHGDIESLLEGARQAKALARKRIVNDCGGLLIDCISRAMFMEHEFQKELDLVKCSTPLNGVLTIGEISNSGESYLEIFNKTIVVGLW